MEMLAMRRVFDALRQVGRAASVLGIGVVPSLVLSTPRLVEAVPVSVQFGDLSQAGVTISGVTGVWDLAFGSQTVVLATVDIEHEEPFSLEESVVTPDFTFSLPLAIGGASQTLSFRYFGVYRQQCLLAFCDSLFYHSNIAGPSAPTEFLISDPGFPFALLLTLRVDPLLESLEETQVFPADLWHASALALTATATLRPQDDVNLPEPPPYVLLLPLALLAVGHALSRSP
jgi:hypothetical protein